MDFNGFNISFSNCKVRKEQSNKLHYWYYFIQCE